MPKFKITILSILCVAIFGVFTSEIFAATYLNLSLNGNITYTATEVGAEIFCANKITQNGTPTDSFMSLTGTGKTDSDGIYSERGNALNYSNISGTINPEFTGSSDSFVMHLFIKNTGSRYIVPQVGVNYESAYLTLSQEAYFFDNSAGNIDPVALKRSGADATSMISQVTSATKSNYEINSYIDNNDTYFLKLVFAISNTVTEAFTTSFSINVSFLADVQYDATNSHLLTVCQEMNSNSSDWTKVGYNKNLTAEATKIETNSLTTLKGYANDLDENGNTNNVHNVDDYITAVIYKDIDLVNVDIATGEIVGKLSDVNYPFEWYGGTVALPAGTILASGRVLDAEEAFTVDVYTYYPTMYVRRWCVGNVQYITISDQSFAGSSKIDAYYTGTFETTIFNPDYSIASNSYGIITRSYSYWWSPTANGVASYLQQNYNFGTYSDSTNNTTQSRLLGWSSNLTKAWQEAALNPNLAPYLTEATGVQCENWRVWMQSILYIVKYANNDSQVMIGSGNVDSYSRYSASGVTVETSNGTITTGGNDSNTRYESQKGGGFIGIYGKVDTSAGEGVNFNKAGMAYGYSLNEPLYSQKFLTYSNGEKRILLDGYVGSDKYTSVWCLGLNNLWGNLWKWISGTAVLYDSAEEKAWVYINYEDYNYSSVNYVVSSISGTFEQKELHLLNKNYVKLTYNLPNINGYYRYTGTSQVTSGNGLQSIIGLPSQGAVKDASNDSSSFNDLFWAAGTNGGVLGICRGGTTQNSYNGGLNGFNVTNTIDSAANMRGFRTILVS